MQPLCYHIAFYFPTEEAFTKPAGFRLIGETLKPTEQLSLKIRNVSVQLREGDGASEVG